MGRIQTSESGKPSRETQVTQHKLQKTRTKLAMDDVSSRLISLLKAKPCSPFF
jgi:hypothetical protein